MKITCDIIRDLLPLYAEDLESPDSRRLVEDHLQGCAECTHMLEDMKRQTKMPVEINVEPLNKVKKTIRRRRVLSVMTAVMFLVTLIFSGVMFLNARIYLPADMAIEGVELQDDGVMRVRLSKYVIGTGTCGIIESESDGTAENCGIITWSTLYKILAAKDRLPYHEMPEEYRELVPEESYGSKGYSMFRLGLGDVPWDMNLWYCDPRDGTGDTLLWDAGKNYDGMPFADVNYHIAWYCLLLIGLAMILMAASRWLSHLWLKELAVRLAILCASLSCATVIVTAGQFMECRGEFTDAVRNGACLAVPMLLTSLFARQLWFLNRKDREDSSYE